MYGNAVAESGFRQTAGKTTKRILALDLMTVLGWAGRARDGAVMYGTHDFKGKGTEGAGMRWLRFRNWLVSIKAEMQPTSIFFEEVKGFPPKNRGRDRKIYDGFETTLCFFCEEHEIPYQGIGVGTIKKHVTGKGNASKDDVIKAVCQLGYKPDDSNQADAIALLLYAEEVML